MNTILIRHVLEPFERYDHWRILDSFEEFAVATDAIRSPSSELLDGTLFVISSNRKVLGSGFIEDGKTNFSSPICGNYSYYGSDWVKMWYELTLGLNLVCLICDFKVDRLKIFRAMTDIADRCSKSQSNSLYREAIDRLQSEKKEYYSEMIYSLERDGSPLAAALSGLIILDRAKTWDGSLSLVFQTMDDLTKAHVLTNPERTSNFEEFFRSHISVIDAMRPTSYRMD